MVDEQPTDAPPGGDTPFRRFEDFARRIVAVPKHEIDEQEKDEANES